MSKTGFRKFHISFIDVMAGKLRPSILYIVFSLGMQREREYFSKNQECDCVYESMISLYI